MITVRQAMFETNSSSCHSVAIRTGGNTMKSQLQISDGEITINCGEFGWEEDEYTDSVSKLSYLLTYIANKYSSYRDSDEAVEETFVSVKQDKDFQLLHDIVQKESGASLVMALSLDSGFYSFGYIDHQSGDIAKEILSGNKEEITQFIYNPNYVLITDNDNH